MKASHLLILFPLFFLLSAGCQNSCRTYCSIPLRNLDYEYLAEDEPQEKQIKLTLTSKSKRSLCAGRESWPDISGMSPANGNGVYVVVKERIYALKENESLGYCPEKSCYNPLGPGQQLVAFLRYTDFSLPEEAYDLPKVLKFNPQPFWCDLGHFADK